jgi:competence protein ComEA
MQSLILAAVALTTLATLGPQAPAPRFLRAFVSAPPACDRPAAALHGGGARAGRSALGPGERIAVNHATTAELERLPGIGPAKAERLAHERDRRPFRGPGDLRRVKGIGRKTAQRLAPLIDFSP